MYWFREWNRYLLKNAKRHEIKVMQTAYYSTDDKDWYLTSAGCQLHENTGYIYFTFAVWTADKAFIFNGFSGMGAAFRRGLEVGENGILWYNNSVFPGINMLFSVSLQRLNRVEIWATCANRTRYKKWEQSRNVRDCDAHVSTEPDASSS